MPSRSAVAGDELAALVQRQLRIQGQGNTPDDAILLDDDIDHSTPTAARSERPRVVSIFNGHISTAEVLSALQARGVRKGEASPDGNCCQRSAGCSAGRLTAVAARSSDSTTLKALSQQRRRIVELVSGNGTALPETTWKEVRTRLDLRADAMTKFSSLGHWSDTGPSFILFLFGLACDLGRPLAVLHRTHSGYADPICVYRAQAPGEAAVRRTSNDGLFEYVRFAELLDWLDASEAWPPPLALVEFVPGHYSPFIYSATRGPLS